MLVTATITRNPRLLLALAGFVPSAPIPLSYLDTDGTLAANSDTKVASQKAVRTYVAANAGGALDADLSAIAALDSATAGAIASDGAGWIKKTYAQFKTALGLVKADVGLGSADNTSDANKPVSTAQQSALDLKQAADAALDSLAALDFNDNGLTFVRVNEEETGFELASVTTVSNTAFGAGWNGVTDVPPSKNVLWDAFGETSTPAFAGLTLSGGALTVAGAMNLAGVSNKSTVLTDLGAQALDADLSAIAALDSATSGAIASDGAGWIKKTYAQFKTALGLVKADVGLGNADNTSDANKPVSTAQQSALDAKAPLNARLASIGITIDGAGSAITTGVKGFITIPYACTINSVTILADVSGSAVVDIWKDTYANYPPTVADTITASAKPTISAATKSTDSTLTGWTTAIADGDVLAFNVDSASTITRLTLILKITKT